MKPFMFVVDVKVRFLMELLSVSTAELYLHKEEND
jgi:hypothetical protein